jgi:uncharacterized protein with ParB-like and HNH nuclease domain
MAKTILNLYDIQTLGTLVETGKIVIPTFQRGFVWRHSQVTEFLRSIYNGYPIGTIILIDKDIEDACVVNAL